MKRILLYGDSNTYGASPEWTFDSGEPARHDRCKIWPVLLKNALGNDYEIMEEGLCGRTTVFTDSINPYLNGKEYVTPCICTHYPFDLMVIMLGTNDVKATFSPSVLSCRQAMEELIKTIRNPFLYTNGICPPLLLVAPAPLREHIKDSQFYGLYDEHSVSISKQLSGIYEDIASSFDCFFLDAGQYACASPVDCLHLDTENHKKLADAILHKILEILK